LSDLPPLPLELFPADKWMNVGRFFTESFYVQPHTRFDDRVIPVMASRGCPFQCIFCHHISRPRYRPMPLVMKEAKELLERYDGNRIDFADDMAIATPSRARELIDGIRSLGRPITYSLSTRVDTFARLDDAILAELAETGCRKVSFGFESGSDRILKLIGKNTTAEQMLQQVERCEEFGLFPMGGLMIGHPGETLADVEATIQFADKAVRICPNIQLGYSICTPFPGTAIANRLFSEGYVKDNDDYLKKYYTKGSVWNFGTCWHLVTNLTRIPTSRLYRLRVRAYISYAWAKVKYLGIEIVFVDGVKTMLGIVRRKIWRHEPPAFYWEAQRRLELMDLALRGIKRGA
jgi:radical SAM superfamily enzyme YgiQ (UPF0313 family)